MEGETKLGEVGILDRIVDVRGNIAHPEKNEREEPSTVDGRASQALRMFVCVESYVVLRTNLAAFHGHDE